MSANLRQQAWFMRKTRQAFDSLKLFHLERRHYDFIRSFLQKERRLSWWAIGCILVQNVAEISLIILGRWTLKRDLAWSASPLILVSFVFFILLFLGVSFLAIKLEKTWVVRLTNELRRRLIKGFLNRRSPQAQSETQAQLIAKISYHLTLVSMGATNSLVGAVNLLFLWPGVIVIAILGGALFWWGLLGLFVLSISLLGISYFISRYYVNLETTFYSEIIRQIDQAGSEWSFVKKFHQEPQLYQQIDRLVDLDSYVRVRRDLWMKFGNSIVFVLLLVINIGATVYLKLFSPFNLVALGDKFLSFIFLFYASLLLYGHMRVGLFFPPLKLGIILAVPRFFRQFTNHSRQPLRSQIAFKSRKTKLFKEGLYHKNLEFSFQCGQRILITGGPRCGKTALAKIFSGLANRYPLAWHIHLDGQRLSYPDWSVHGLAYYIDPELRTQKRILEVVLGQSHEMIQPAEMARAMAVLSIHPQLFDLVASDRKVHVSAESAMNNPVSNFALQAVHCLVTKPAIIVVDNLWLDLHYPEIISGLQLLADSLPQTIIISLARQSNNFLAYDKTYVIQENK